MANQPQLPQPIYLKENWLEKHNRILSEKAKINVKDIEKLFLGDSMFGRLNWTGEKMYNEKLAHNSLCAGLGGDSVQGLYFRVTQSSLLDNMEFKSVYILIGTNDVSTKRSIEYIVNGITNIVAFLAKSFPDVNIKVIEILPRYDSQKYYEKLCVVNEYLRNDKSLATNKVSLIDLSKLFLDPKLFENDGLHLNKNGYDILIKYLAEN